MSEYIEKQAAATIPVLPKEHRKYQTANLDDAYENGWYDALKCVEKIPPADVRPVVRGRWIDYDDDYGAYCCSVCEQNAPEDTEWPYCPHCGADMREEKSERG